MSSAIEWLEYYESLGLHPVLLFGVKPDPANPGTLACGCQRAKCGKSAGKHPMTKGWQTLPYNAKMQAGLRAFLVDGAGNIGLRMGLQPDGKARIAIDVDHPERFAELEARLGALPDTLSTLTGRDGGGYHMIFEVPAESIGGYSCSVGLEGAGFDVRAEGGQVVAAPSTHYSGRQYDAVQAPIAALPAAWAEYLLALCTKHAPDQSDAGDPPEPSEKQDSSRDVDIVEQLASVWQQDVDGDRAFGGLGGALLRAGVSEERAEWIAEALADVVSSSHAGPAARVQQAYDGLCPLGWPALREALSTNGAGLPGDEPGQAAAIVRRVLNGVEQLILDSVDAPQVTVPSEPDPEPVGDPEPEGYGEEPRAGARRGLETVSAAELDQPLPDVPWLCERLSLAPGRPVLWAAAASTGKTVAVQDLAISVAAGIPVFSAFPVRKGAVLHIDLDQGAFATRRRYKQLCAGRGLVLGDLDIQCVFFKFAMTTNGCIDTDSVNRLGEASEDKALVIIDSLRGMMPGAEENSSAFGDGMQMLSKLVDSLERSQNGVAPTFLVLHHAGKSESTAAGRGSSAIDDRSGAKWVLKRGKDTNTVLWEQYKTSEFSLSRDRQFTTAVELGELDAKGVPLSVRVVVVPEPTEKQDAAKEASDWDQACRFAFEYVQEYPGATQERILSKLTMRKDAGRELLGKMVEGAHECLDRRLYNYPAAAKEHHYFTEPKETLILKQLTKGPMIEITLSRETCLPEKHVKSACADLRATGKIHAVTVRGEPGWQLVVL